MEKDKNYKIYAIKYEELFDKIEKLDLLFNINHDKIKLEERLETDKGEIY